MKKRACIKLFLSALLLLSCFLQGQNEKIDKLNADLRKHPSHDTAQMNILNDLGYELQETGDFLLAVQYARRAAAIGDSLKKNSSDAREKSDIDLLISDAYNVLGLTYNGVANYPEALKYHLATLQIRENLKDKRGIANSYMNIGITYKRQQDYDHALKYYHMAYEMQKEMGNERSAAGSMHNIGVIHMLRQEYTKALEYINKAIAINLKTNNKAWLANNYMAIGYMNEDLDSLDAAIKNYNSSLTLMEELGNRTGIAQIYDNLASISNKRKEYKQARAYIEKSLELCFKIDAKDLIRNSYNGLAFIDSIEGKAKDWLEHCKLYVAYRDSVDNQENTGKMVRSQMQYEFDKKESIARAEQEKREAIVAEESRRQQILLWGVSGLGLLALGFGVFAYRSNLQKKKDNREITRQKLVIEEKQKEILDSIHYAKRIQECLMPREFSIARELSRLMRP